MIEVINASFLKSCTTKDNMIDEGMSEIAFLGRSNVGKSSFINSLLNRKNLAKSSSTPGKTRLINFFEITYRKNQEKYLCRFVDLPGFGYAKVSKSMQEEWSKHLNNFIINRASIRVFVHLIDARHPNQTIDKNVKDFLKTIKKNDQRIIEIFTKCDKLNQKELFKLKKEFQNGIFVSNLKQNGIKQANEIIFNSIFG